MLSMSPGAQPSFRQHTLSAGQTQSKLWPGSPPGEFPQRHSAFWVTRNSRDCFAILAIALLFWHVLYNFGRQVVLCPEKKQIVSMRQIEALVGSELRARLLHWFYVEAQPDVAIHEREIARRTGIAPGSVHHALKRLEEGQLIVREESLRGPQYRAPYEDARLQPLFAFFRQESRLVSALRKALADVPHVAYGCVFGSFAKGTAGATSDVDVLVLEESRDARQRVLSVLAKVEESTQRRLDITTMSVEKFRLMLGEQDAFALSVVASQRIVLKGETDPWV